MSSRIARTLDQPERQVTKLITALEDKNGYPSHDARHLAENVQLVRRKLADLDLDPDDTTAEELYHSLLVKFEKDSLAFDIENNFHTVDIDAKIAKARDIVESNTSLPQRWVLKTTAAKSLLRQQPPKKLMKQLSFRSADSMLKRQNTSFLFVCAYAVESAAWRKDLHRKISKLDSTAFELRQISIISLKLASDASPLVYNDDIGVLAILHSDLVEKIRLLGLSVLISEFVASLSDSPIMIQSETLRWWSDMDGLIAELDGKHVSFNLKDTALSHAQQHSFVDRLLDAGHSHFWKSLLSRYENQLVIEEDTLADLSGHIVLPKVPIRQPAFEYVEDF